MYYTSFHDAVRAAVKNLTLSQNKIFWATTAGVAATAVVGSLATKPNSMACKTLKKPAFQLPSWLFPVTWTALYADIAAIGSLSIADLGEQAAPRNNAYVAALATNLVLNAGWSTSVLRPQAAGPRSRRINCATASTADLVRRSGKVSMEKGVVLAPYAGWTAFAAVLTGTIRALNPRRD